MSGDPRVVILCGGQGTRLKEETEFRPKPMVGVGGRPLLWHIMRIYGHFGFDSFVLNNIVLTLIDSQNEEGIPPRLKLSATQVYPWETIGWRCELSKAACTTKECAFS